MHAGSQDEEAVVERIDAIADEIVDFLQSLTRIPTVNPPGEHYLECAHAIGTRLRAFGYSVRFIEAIGCAEHTPAYPRVNVIGHLAGDGPKPLLHFNGHFDVVPAGAGWTRDPFGAVVEDGCVFGRGTSDQKAGIAASIYAVEAIRRAGVELHGAVEQSGTVDEESGGFAGVAYLAANGHINRDRTDYVIITEPLGVGRVCLGHRGVYWLKIETLGHMAHGSMPFLGISAISKMTDFLHAIEHELKPELFGRITQMPVEPPEARSASININSIFGGQRDGGMQTPCVADYCEAVLDRRFLMEEAFGDVRGEIIGVLDRLSERDPGFRYRVEDLMTVFPVQTAADCRLVREVSSAITGVLGTAPPLIASPGTYDQKHVMRLGLVEQCIAYGPGLLHMSHQPDEYCRIDDLVAATKVMALAAMRLVGESAC